MIVRELVAMFGLDFDRKSAKDADSAVERVKDGLKNLGISFSIGAAFAGLTKLATYASDADETLNVLNQSFGENTKDVLSWADKSGEAMGRSKYAMRELASQFGAVLAPMMGTREEAAEMSKTLADLAVDLGSFFNMKDAEAQQRLLSGLMGETESVRRLGVALDADSLKQFARTQGIKKSVEKMTQQEKVHLRYLKILADTKDKQGDAIRTAAGYANSMKRLEGNVQTLGVTLGRKLLQPFGQLIGLGADFAKFVEKAAADTKIFEVALIAAGAAAAVFALRMALANLPIILFAGFVALVIALVEDMYGMFEGKRSVIDDFFTKLVGKEEWERIKKSWKEGLEAVGHLIYEWINGIDGAWGRFMERLGFKKDAKLGDLIAKAADNAIEESLPDDEDDLLSWKRGYKNMQREWEIMKGIRDAIPHPKLNAFEAIGDISRGELPIHIPPWMQSLIGTQPQQSITAPAGGKGSVNIRGGDTHVHVGAGATPDAVREAERAAQRLQEKQSRDLKNSAAAAGGAR